MKIGILTFHSALNYGAVLQCHGLLSTIKALGHDVSVIDYRPSYLYCPRPSIRKKLWIMHPLKALRLNCSISFWRKSYDKFLKFQEKNWLRTEPVYDIINLKSVTDSFDVIVVGSDQVWASKHNGNDQVWYGISGSKAKWITYAASAGDSDFSEEEKRKIKGSLQNFSTISVREMKLGDIVRELTGKVVPLVLDPTLLSSPNIWKSFEKPIINCDYIVVYQARPDNNIFRIAEDIKKQLAVDKIIVLDNHSNVKLLGYTPYCASPSEFVSIIANCKCLITTSYHGTAFAIITGVPFFTLKLNDGADERSENLLTLLNISNRLVDKTETPSFSALDRDVYNEKLDELRKLSLRILSQEIEG